MTTSGFHCLNYFCAAHSVYQPNKVVLGNVGAVEEFVRTLSAKEKQLVYLCRGNACQAPTSEVAEVKKNLLLP